MVVDEELSRAREAVLELVKRSREDLTPRQIIDQSVASGFSEDLIRSANISLVASGQLEITPSFELRLAKSAMSVAS